VETPPANPARPFLHHMMSLLLLLLLLLRLLRLRLLTLLLWTLWVFLPFCNTGKGLQIRGELTNDDIQSATAHLELSHFEGSFRECRQLLHRLQSPLSAAESKPLIQTAIGLWNTAVGQSNLLPRGEGSSSALNSASSASAHFRLHAEPRSKSALSFGTPALILNAHGRYQSRT
jgi:hypothetical protein